MRGNYWKKIDIEIDNSPGRRVFHTMIENEGIVYLFGGKVWESDDTSDYSYYSNEVYEVEDNPIMTMYGKDINKAILVA